MESDSKLDDLLSPPSIKLEVSDEVARYRLVDGRLIAMDSDSNIMSQFSADADLCLTSQPDELNGVYSEDNEVETGALDDDTIDSNDNILVQLMDIRTSLSRLRIMLEQRIGTDLSDYEFWLQDSKKLESHKTLVEQCIDRAGLVQVNIQIRPHQRRINIVDVLKPDEEFLHMAKQDRLAFMEMPSLQGEMGTVTEPGDMSPGVELMEEVSDPLSMESVENTEPAITTLAGGQVSKMAKWMVDAQFKADQLRLRIPEDPKFWSIPQVRHWIQWAVRQFNLTGIKLSDWSISGKELCDMSLQEFKDKCPSDPGDLFWTHLELLRNCKFIAVVQNEDPNESDSQNNSSTSPAAIRKKPKAMPPESKITSTASISLMTAGVSRSGYNGQIQLWQFLLELLTSTDHTQVIQWIGTNGEFKLQEPEIVARLWGLRKHKPTMNYEKLSRALRYYYDGDMISKVHGKRFVYRFVCDLKQLIGYDAGDLARLVNKGAPKYDTEDSNHFQLYS